MQLRTVASYNTKIIVFITVTAFISESEADMPSIKDFILRPMKKESYTPTKWAASSTAMDVWYGNRTMIDVLSKEFSDVVHKMSTRPMRSPSPYSMEKGIDKVSKTKDPYDVPTLQVSKVEINFFNNRNETVHTIQLMPLARPIHNTTVFRVLEPLLRNHDY